MQQALHSIWERRRPELLHRLSILQSAHAAVNARSLEPELQQQAIRAAHGLAGALGVFGRAQGTFAATAVEAALQAVPLDPGAFTAALQRLEAELRPETGTD